MEDLSVNEMLGMQSALQEKYKAQWGGLSPEAGKSQLLWMIGEVGEVIDIIKKHGAEAANADSGLRGRLIEEMADVLMHYHDVLLCYGITAEELKKAYVEKFHINMERW